jgi:hypothetical protein
MKTLNKTYLLQIVAIVVLTSFVTDASAKKKPKLGGEWKLNTEESIISNQMSFAPSTVVISQDRKTIQIIRHLNIQGQEAIFDEQLTLNGLECTNDGPLGSTVLSTATWSEDGQSLIIKSLIKSSYGDFNNELLYSLVQERLKIISVFSFFEGDINETWVLEKKN